MTDEAIRIAVAECCGWKCQRMDQKGGRTGLTLVLWYRPDGTPTSPHPTIEGTGELGYLPDFPADLNACAEMVNALDRYTGDRSQWAVELRRIVVRDAEGKGLEHPDTDRLDDAHFYNASARQRCEAFLRVKGLWKP